MTDVNIKIVLREFLQRRGTACDRCATRLCNCAVPPPQLQAPTRPTLSEVVLAVIATECFQVDARLTTHVLQLQDMFSRWDYAYNALRIEIPLTVDTYQEKCWRIMDTLTRQIRRYHYSVLPNMLHFEELPTALVVFCLPNVFKHCARLDLTL